LGYRNTLDRDGLDYPASEILLAIEI
jgi:hypothetical protein